MLFTRTHQLGLEGFFQRKSRHLCKTRSCLYYTHKRKDILPSSRTLQVALPSRWIERVVPSEQTRCAASSLTSYRSRNEKSAARKVSSIVNSIPAPIANRHNAHIRRMPANHFRPWPVSHPDRSPSSPQISFGPLLSHQTLKDRDLA